MQLTKGAIGNLINRYRAVLKKCHLLNVFGSLAVAGMLVMGGAAAAGAATVTTGQDFKDAVTDAEAGATITLGQDIEQGLGAVFDNKDVTVDFAGHRYTAYAGSVGSTGTESQLFQLLKGSTVTLKNGTLDVASPTDESGKFKMVLQNYCNLTLENMVVDGSNLQDSVSYTMSNNHGNVVIKDSTIIAKEGGFAFDVYYWSKDYEDGVSVTVTDSIIDGRIEVTVDGNKAIGDNTHSLSISGGMLVGGLTATDGGQLYTVGTTFLSNVDINNNTATNRGGGIYNAVQNASDGNVAGRGQLTLDGVSFSGNKAAQGGAIYNAGTLTVEGGSFTGNSAAPADGSTVTVSNVGGAIYNADDATLSIDGTRFEGNTAAIAGAVNNQYASSHITGITNAVFVNNTASLSAGGALRNQGTIDSIAGTTFEGNTAGNGGALWNGAGGTIASITDTTFTGNKSTNAAVGGGAITNAGEISKINATTFTDNSAAGNGGAINNVKGGKASITLSDTTFTGNTAAGNGGAIYNAADSSITFKGTNTFTGNTAAEGKDIYNEGTLTMTGDSHLIVDGNQNIYNTSSATLTVNSGAKLTITDAVAGGEYKVVTGGNLDIETGAWSGDNLQASSDMVALSSNSDGTFTAEGRDAHTVFPNLSEGMTNAVNDLYAPHKGADGKPWNYADVNSDQMGVRFLSRATDNTYLGADKNAAAATIESAARIAFAGAVPQMTKMASDAGTNAVVNRLGFANPADGAQAMDAEGKIVDRNTTGFALWIAPLWQSQHGWGMEADNLDYGFNGNLGGVSLGADYTFENAIRAGITFNIGGGYAESSGGDLNSTENRMSFWGLGAYAGWNYENFGLMADVSYTSTWNDLKQDMDSRMGMGDLEADVQASAISAGLRAEYKLETSVLDVIPHIGVRYMSLNTWGFDAESNGGTVLEGDGFHQDIWTFPVGVTFTKDFTLDSGWSFKPSIDFSVIPAAGDIKAKQDVAFTGLPGSYEVETQMMDYLTWQGGVGLEMGNDTMSFGVNYTLQAGQHTTGHGVFGSFRYEF